MTVHVELTKGQSAELRDPRTLTVKQRRPFDLAVAAVQVHARGELSAVSGNQVLQVGEIALAVLLESWTYDLPLPTIDDQTMLEDFTVDDYDALMGAVSQIIKQMGGGTRRE